MGINLSKNALTTLEERMFFRDEEGKIVEGPEGFFHRVAKCPADVEKTEELRDEWYLKFHQILTNLDFLPNSPTLMNAGLPNGQLSACFVLPIEDSIDSIFETLKNAAKIHQSGGGTGFSFSRLREDGAQVDSKQGVASGPISFASVYNQSTEIMKQGGKRKGANMMNLSVHHPNILNFIDMKAHDNKTMANFNVSVTITDEFMEAYKTDKMYALRSPQTGKMVAQLSAVDVLEKIAENAWKSAEPGMIFIDRVNQASPYHEEIEATNPCGEQPLPPYGACNLGSINLSNFVKYHKDRPAGFRSEKWRNTPEGVDWLRLADVVQVAVRYLDNVIDANHYPIPEIDEHAKKYRNIGLGVMGWADMLLKLRIPYGSPESIKLADEIQSFMNIVAHKYSELLGKIKGVPEGAPFTSPFVYANPRRRNATLTTVAPTGTLCILARCSSGIEPNFAFHYEKHVLDQVLIEEHPIYMAAKREGWYSEEVFVDAHSVSPNAHVDMQAAFQGHCDSGISKTINLPKTATKEDVLMAYLRAWDTGCKGITVYRDGSREGVLHKTSGRDVDLVKDEESIACDCGGRIVTQNGCESCTSCGASKCLIS